MPSSEQFPSTAHDRLDKAASKATELVQHFVNVEDPYSPAEENPWSKPDRIFQELKVARDELVEAWQDLEKETEALASGGGNAEGKHLDPDRCLALYMDMITDAFADTLEHMRTVEGDSLKVDVLVDCLQSGLELLTSDEQEALLFSQSLDHEFDGDGDDDQAEDKEENLTCHELHRRKIGLDVTISG